MPRRPELQDWFVPPMQALAVQEVPAGRWRSELKFDGVRALAAVTRDGVELWSRNRHALGHAYPTIRDALGRIRDRPVILDGEIVALGPGGLPSFQLLQRRSTLATPPPLAYHVFDVLRVGPRSLLDQPLEIRQRELRRILGTRPPPPLRISKVFRIEPAKLLQAASRDGWEGIVAKRPDSVYEPGRRTGAWLKCKVRFEQEFVVGGFTPPRGRRAGFGALLVGYRENDVLRYAGKVGTGFSDGDLTTLHRRLSRRTRRRCPFTESPPERQATWVRPDLVCQVAFAEWTQDGRLRQPAFLGMREDKAAGDVMRERTLAAQDLAR